MENTYHVVKIIDAKTIAINYGKDDGAEEGMKIRIFKKGEEIVDPLTEKSLGTMDIIKEQLTISLVYKKFSLCKKVSFPGTDFERMLNPLSKISQRSKEYEDINIEADLLESLLKDKDVTKADLIVKVGDLVEIIKT